MPELKGSKTEANFDDRFCRGIQARNKYTYYAFQGQEGRLCADCRHLEGDSQQRERARQNVV